MISPDTPAYLLLSQRLRDGERLLWYGRPLQGLRLHSSDVTMIPFSLLWSGFAFFWEYSVIHSSASLLFRLWGVPFVLTGIYMLVGRFFYDAYRRARTWYGLSDRRAIIVSQVWGINEKSVNPGAVEQIEVDRQANGIGSIYFGTRPPLFRPRGSKAVDPPAFELIENVEQVYRLILKNDFKELLIKGPNT